MCPRKVLRKVLGPEKALSWISASGDSVSPQKISARLAPPKLGSVKCFWSGERYGYRKVVRQTGTAPVHFSISPLSCRYRRSPVMPWLLPLCRPSTQKRWLTDDRAFLKVIGVMDALKLAANGATR